MSPYFVTKTMNQTLPVNTLSKGKCRLIGSGIWSNTPEPIVRGFVKCSIYTEKSLVDPLAQHVELMR